MAEKTKSIKYIIACANGAGFYGYTNAKVIEIENEKIDVEELAFNWASDTCDRLIKEERKVSGHNVDMKIGVGFSYDFFLFDKNIKNSVGGRLKESAIEDLKKIGYE